MTEGVETGMRTSLASNALVRASPSEESPESLSLEEESSDELLSEDMSPPRSVCNKFGIEVAEEAFDTLGGTAFVGGVGLAIGEALRIAGEECC